MNRVHRAYGSIVTALVLALAAGGPVLRARDATAEYDLFMEQSPGQAGDITPNAGTHRFGANCSISLRATPQPGYRFAYWLGDVSDPSAECTTIVLNECKVVVAVYDANPEKRVEERLHGGGGGGGGTDGLGPAVNDFGIPSWTPAGGHRAVDTASVVVPVVIPEPATMAMLVAGLLALRPRRPASR